MSLNCAAPCVLTDITRPTSCLRTAGLSKIYWTTIADIDLVLTKANITAGVLSTYVMAGGGVFKSIEFDREAAFYTLTYTEDADAYDVLITMIMEGKDAVRTEALRSALGCCDIVIHTVDQSCVERVIGVDWNSVDLIEAVRRLRIGRHLDASGQKGTDKARDEIDITGLQGCPALYSTADANSLIPV